MLPRELLTAGEAKTLALPWEPGCLVKAPGWERAGDQMAGGPARSGVSPPAQHRGLRWGTESMSHMGQS